MPCLLQHRQVLQSYPSLKLPPSWYTTVRRQSDGPAKAVQSMRGGLQQLIVAPRKAFSNARAAVGRTSAAVYNRMPASVRTYNINCMNWPGQVVINTASMLQAQRLVNSATQPGSMQKVISLQFEAFWQRHGRKVLALGAAVLVYLLWCVSCCVSLHLWQKTGLATPEVHLLCAFGAACFALHHKGDSWCRRTMFGVTSMFINLSETMAEFGFLVRPAMIVIFVLVFMHVAIISLLLCHVRNCVMVKLMGQSKLH